MRQNWSSNYRGSLRQIEAGQMLPQANCQGHKSRNKKQNNVRDYVIRHLGTRAPQTYPGRRAEHGRDGTRISSDRDWSPLEDARGNTKARNGACIHSIEQLAARYSPNPHKPFTSVLDRVFESVRPVSENFSLSVVQSYHLLALLLLRQDVPPLENPRNHNSPDEPSAQKHLGFRPRLGIGTLRCGPHSCFFSCRNFFLLFFIERYYMR